MKPRLSSPRWVALALVLLTVLVASCVATTVPGTVPPRPPAASPTDAESSASTATPIPLKLLRTSPEIGPVGTTFTLSGEDLAPGQEVEFQWVTWDGAYVTEVSAENVRFYERTFAEKRVPLGHAVVDGQGRVTATFTVPEDYGEVHDIYAVVDGQDVAKGGFRVLRTATFIPTTGPVGTPITVTIKGIGWKPFENTMAARYDNRYTGFVSAVTTKGTAIFQIRAAGPVGQHTVQVTGASAAAPYLNLQQSPLGHIDMDFSWAFTVTEDAGPPPNVLDWPDESAVAAISQAVPRTAASNLLAESGASVTLDPASGPILSQTTLRATGLPADTAVSLFWVSVRGNRLSPTGWSLLETPLPEATTAEDGSLTATVEIPDDLGGWHVVKLVQGEQVLAEVPYFVERSLVAVTPQRVKAGETFTVQIKGIGWTELDNGIAVTYDNAYIGYACGFNSNGDVTITLVATGGPGTHLIDLYPMIYRAKGTHPPEYWNFQLPHLTALYDAPGLPLGYALPIYRLAIVVTE